MDDFWKKRLPDGLTMLDGYYNFLRDLLRLFNYCIQNFDL